MAETDLISRQDALNCFHAWVDKNGDVYTPDDMPEYQAIEALPSAQRTGEWIAEEEYGDLWVCDQCGFASEHNDNYCPNCGAEMKNNGDD